MPMPHSVCTAEGATQLEYAQRVSETLFAPEMELGARIRHLFETETADFDLETAFFSRIDTDAETERFDIVHNGHGDLAPNNTVALSTTYCRKTIAAPDGTLAVSDADAEGWTTDPAYERFNLGSYLGTTVTVGDDLYGTLCYANTDPRPEPITDEEMALVEMESQWLGYLLAESPSAEPTDTLDGAFEGWQLSTDRLDSVMNALSKSERRLVLSSLLDSPTTDVGPLAQQTPEDHTLTLLYHAHLPKLADEAYIEWDTDSKAVTRGPNFDDVEPLLRLLVQHHDDFPL
jgi:hypothetical protein